ADRLIVEGEALFAHARVGLAGEGQVTVVGAQHLSRLLVQGVAADLAHAVDLVLAGLGAAGVARRVGLADLVAAQVVLVGAIARLDVTAEVDRARDDAIALRVGALALPLAVLVRA